MKTLPTALAAHVATRSTMLAHALKITRTDGQVFGFTEHDVDSPSIGGVIYKANPGLNVTDIVNSADLSVANLELTTLHDGSVFTTAQILGGVWRNAAFDIFRYNWASSSDGVDNLLSGTIGECEIRQNTVMAELRDLRQYLQQPVGSSSSKNCRYRLGSTDKNNGGLCLKNISGSPFSVSFTVTGVTSNQVFRDSGRGEAADWFGDGEVRWLTGDNAGISSKVKTYDADGTFTLTLPMLSAVQVGDTGTAIAGCRKRLEEDCRDKFDNVLNFGGEPHRQGLNDLTRSPG